MPDSKTPRGLEWRQSQGQWTMTAACHHQAGRLYVVEGATSNWVCSSQARPSHSLAGFFRELGELEDPRIKELMHRWGLYFRQIPLAEQPTEEEKVEAS